MDREINLIELAGLRAEARAALMTRAEADLSEHLEPVRAIIAAVAAEGDGAVARYGRELDGAAVDADHLLATPAEFERAFAELEPAVHDAIAFAIENIRAFHEAQKPQAMWLKEIRPGVFAGERSGPIPSVACYVPRGKGAFPSVMMMTTIPAVIAGVPEIAVLTPPTPEGGIDAASLVAARLAGVDKVYKCGGAVAVAAAAYGTGPSPRLLQDRRSRQPLGGRGQAAAGRSDRHRPAGRPERGDRARRCHRQPQDRRPRPPDRSRARPRQLRFSRHPRAAPSPRPPAPRSRSSGHGWASNGSPSAGPC